MKKLLTLSFVFALIFTFLPYTAQAATGEWTCLSGTPRATVEWSEVIGATSYDVFRYVGSGGGTPAFVTTIYNPQTFFVDNDVDYNSYYEYTITPNNNKADQKATVQTGSCIYLPSVNGPNTATVGVSTGPYTASFVYGYNPGNVSFVLEIVASDTSRTWIAGGSPSLSANATFPSAGIYQVCATGVISESSSVSGSVLEANQCISVTVIQKDASMAHTFSDGETSKVINVDGSVVTIGSGTNVTSCEKSTIPPQGFPNVDYFDVYNADENGNLILPQTTVGGFSQPTTGTPYYLKLTCSSDNPFSYLEEESSLAKILEPFFGFAEKVYADTSTLSLEVFVNAIPQAVLNVNSSGATNVSITGSYSDTTNYTVEQTSTISGTLTAPSTAGENEFTSWTGNCTNNPDAGNTSCVVSVAPGNTGTVSANYSAPTAQDLPNLDLNGLAPRDGDYQSGDSVPFQANVVNLGTADASGFSAKLWLDLNNDGNGVFWDVVNESFINGLTAGQSTIVYWNPVSVIEGTHRLKACADSQDQIEESNEYNNCDEYLLTISGVDDATLNVQSSGVSGVVITRISGPADIAGTTNYTRSYGNDFSTVIQAPAISGGGTFSGWTGCSSVSSQNCSVVMYGGESRTVTANYSTSGSFSYSLSNSGTLTIDKSTGVGQEVITRNLISGIPQAVSLAVSGLPSGVTISGISNNPCSPTCSSTLTFDVSPSTANGDYTIIVAGSPGSVATNFTLSITGSPMVITCTPDPATAMIGQPVTWTASVTGGVAPYTYSWSGSGIPIDPVPDVNPYSVTYSTIGQKTATAQVTDDEGSVASCPGSSSVQINFNPTFEEF